MSRKEAGLNDKIALELRLKKHTVITDDKHWLWIGETKYGYGRVYIEGKLYRVHRLSAYIFLGLSLDDSLQANHKLNCVHKNCWNPNCLYVGTQSDNGTDVTQRNNECILFRCGHEKTEENTILTRRIGLRTLYITKECRVCHNAAAKRSYDRRKGI
jgi:hypothetical protein